MCYGLSMIARQGARTVDWDELNPGHAAQIEKLGLRDDKLVGRRIVRLEASRQQLGLRTGLLLRGI